MAKDTQLTTHELWVDGRAMSISVQKASATSLTVTWAPPSTITAFDGFIVLLSESPFSANNFPEDGKRYTPSTNWAAPADKIGDSIVIASAYGFFGDDITVKTVTVSNIDPNKLYYASVHAASSVLQYYTIGVQSYPLESSRVEKQSSTYAGNIPYASEPPQNPVNGSAYYDNVSGAVLVWNSAANAWLQTDMSTVAVGQQPPVIPNQIFFNKISSQLKVFVAGQWIVCNAANTRIKYGAGFVPLGTVSYVAAFPASPNPGDVCLLTPESPIATSADFSNVLKLYVFGQWINFSSQLVQFETSPNVWTPVVVGNKLFDATDPAAPVIGNFFYNSTTNKLLVWDGSEWTQADTQNAGTPTTDKIGVGSDGSYDERLRLMKTLKAQLGWPNVCAELTEDQFNIAIDNALDTLRQRSDAAYQHRHVLFTLQQGQQTYYLNDPRVKTDRIVTVLKIHRANLLGLTTMTTQGSVYAQNFLNQYYNGAYVDLVSFHLMHQLSESMDRIFANDLAFTWDEATRQLQIHRQINNKQERVILEVAMERTEQELLVDRFCKQWLQAWAYAELRYTLGMIRSKYSSVPGPSGSLTLNGDLLISEANTDFTELLRQITDYEIGNGGVNFGNTAFFIM